MNCPRTLVCLFTVGLVLALVSNASVAQDSSSQSSLGTAFTYQGRLEDASGPVDGDCDLRFKLFNAASGGTQIGGTQTLTGVAVSEGLFTVQLDFGAGAFNGYPRWLEIEVRCPAGNGGYVKLSPRQPLTPAPYALYAAEAGSSSAGTTYTAGTGLSLSNTEFSLRAAYRLPQGCTGGQIAEWSGSAWICGDDDGGGGEHDHWGASWSGSGTGLSLASSNGDGLEITAGRDGLVVTQAAGAGVVVGQAGAPSEVPFSGGNSGFIVLGAEANGLHVGRADFRGVSIGSAGDDGIVVGSVGSPTATEDSSRHNGLEIQGVEGHGLFVGRANYRGVTILSAGDNGLHVHYAGNPSSAYSDSYPDGVEVEGAQGSGLKVGRADRHGVDVSHSGDSGLHVRRAGSPSTITGSEHHNGVEIQGAEGHGLFVGRTDRNGVRVESAQHHGLSVAEAGMNGVFIGSAWRGMEVDSTAREGLSVSDAGTCGVHVEEAGTDGIRVRSAGAPTAHQASTSNNGVEVQGAGGYGLYVGHSDKSGLRVESAAWSGVEIHEAGEPSDTPYTNDRCGVEIHGAEDHGLWVGRADGDGVHIASAGGYAGNFHGDVRVTGTMSKGGGSFKIDHPLDPENRYLQHSFVESPDMMNVYNGNVVLGEEGAAWVTLPDWFEALNQDYRYQLTCIGGFAPVYIAREIEGNRFQIAGGKPGLEVSWQVTGIRHDPFAEANRIVVEVDKSLDELGTYLHPEAYGLPKARGLAHRQAQEDLARQAAGDGGQP
jgi:hypothetical protein